MLDLTGAFSKQFVPCEGGYLFYPGRMTGGKFVTEAEYQDLLAGWHSVAGRKGTWQTVGAVILIIVLGMVARKLLGASDWIETLSVWAAVALVLIRLSWASSAPRRLVKGRPDAAPPRTLAAAKRLARSVLPWQMVIPVFVISTGIFIAGLSAKPQTYVDWLWLTGSGVMSAAYGWIAVQKFRDRRQV